MSLKMVRLVPCLRACAYMRTEVWDIVRVAVRGNAQRVQGQRAVRGSFIYSGSQDRLVKVPASL
jgi:hypothetical protein